MALVMIVVEIISALLAPAAEFAAPVVVLFGEVLFWVVLLVFELIFALIQWRKPSIPIKQQRLPFYKPYFKRNWCKRYRVLYA